jgi:hypothetical protein
MTAMTACVLPAVLDAFVQDLCELECAATLPAEAVCRLLRAALNLQWTEGIEVLSANLLAADDMPASMVNALLDSAIRQLDGEATVYLLGLRGAQALEPHMALQLLQLSLQLRLAEPLDRLCKLEVAKQLTASQVEGTLQLALHTRACAEQGVALLLELPAAQQLSSWSVSSLLQKAASSGVRLAVARLCELPAAQEVESNAAAAVLSAASLELLDGAAVAALCRLPGVQQLPAGDISSMLRGVLRKDGYAVPPAAAALAQQLLQLPGSAAIPADVLTELLQIGSQWKMNAEVMQAVFKLHAAALRKPRV